MRPDRRLDWGQATAVPETGRFVARSEFSYDRMQVSNTPWSRWSRSDYNSEQWERACILDHEQGSTPDERYELPVREPDGTLNRSAIHAAAARLAGAGGGVDAPGDAKQWAAAALVQLYRELAETPPDSITSLAARRN